MESIRLRKEILDRKYFGRTLEDTRPDHARFLSVLIFLEVLLYSNFTASYVFNLPPGLSLIFGILIVPYILALLTIAAVLMSFPVEERVFMAARTYVVILMPIGIFAALLSDLGQIFLYPPHLVILPVLSHLVSVTLFTVLLKQWDIRAFNRRHRQLEVRVGRRTALFMVLFFVLGYFEYIYYAFLPFRSLHFDPAPPLNTQALLGTQVWIRVPGFVLISAVSFALLISPVSRKLILGASIINFLSAFLYMVELPLFESLLLMISLFIYYDDALRRYLDQYRSRHSREVLISLAVIATGFLLTSFHIPESRITVQISFRLTREVSYLPALLVAGVMLCILSLRSSLHIRPLLTVLLTEYMIYFLFRNYSMNALDFLALLLKFGGLAYLWSRTETVSAGIPLH